MKREVAEETATGIGFFEGILDKIPKDILFDAIREMSVNQWIDEKTKSSEIMNMIVTESIRLMTYQEFKEVAPYLFSYPQKQRELDSKLFVKMIEITQEQFDDFQSAIRELMKIRENNMNETTSFDHIKSTAEWHAEEIKRREGTSFFDDTSFFSTSPRDTAIASETDRYQISSEKAQLKSIAEAQIAYLKRQDLWYVGAVDYYEFGFMPDDLIDALLIDGSYGDESDRHEFEDYYGWFKGGGEASNTLIAMPGTSLVDDVFFSDINLINEYDEELDIKEIKKLLDNLSKFEVSPNPHQKLKNKPLRTR